MRWLATNHVNFINVHVHDVLCSICLRGYLSFLFMTDGMQKGKSMSEARRPFYGLDGGFVLGAGTYFVLPPGAGFLSLELRYTGGMVNVADENQEFYADNKEEKGKEQLLLEESIYDTNTVSFILGYYF